MEKHFSIDFTKSYFQPQLVSFTQNVDFGHFCTGFIFLTWKLFVACCLSFLMLILLPVCALTSLTCINYVQLCPVPHQSPVSYQCSVCVDRAIPSACVSLLFLAPCGFLGSLLTPSWMQLLDFSVNLIKGMPFIILSTLEFSVWILYCTNTIVLMESYVAMLKVICAAPSTSSIYS